MTDLEPGSVADGPTVEERESRLSRGASALASGARHSVLQNPQLLLAVAATLMTVGVVAILLAWLGIARSTMVEEQLAYLVSGGLLGLGLVTIGGLAFFSHWITVLIGATREQTEVAREAEAARQRDHEALLAALQRREADGHQEEETNGRSRGTTSRRPVRRAPRSP